MGNGRLGQWDTDKPTHGRRAGQAIIIKDEEETSAKIHNRGITIIEEQSHPEVCQLSAVGKIRFAAKQINKLQELWGRSLADPRTRIKLMHFTAEPEGTIIEGVQSSSWSSTNLHKIFGQLPSPCFRSSSWVICGPLYNQHLSGPARECVCFQAFLLLRAAIGILFTGLRFFRLLFDMVGHKFIG